MKAKQLYLFQSITLTGCLLLSCGKPPKKDSAIQNSSLSPVDEYVDLGRGYSLKNRKFTNDVCVSGTPLRVSTGTSTTGTVTVDSDLSYAKLMRSLVGKIDVGIKFPVIQVGAGAEYVDRNSSTDLSFGFAITSSYVGRSLVFDTPTRMVSQTIASQAPGTNLEELCGDEFVNQIDYGSKFMATLKVTTADEQTLRKIKGYLAVNYNPVGIGIGVDVKGEIEKLDETSKKTTKFSFSIIQEGGDISYTILGMPAKALDCTIETFQLCKDVFDAALNYAKTTYVAGLADETKWKQIGYHTVSYDKTSNVSRLVPQKLSPQQLDLLNSAYQMINESYEKARRDNKDATELLSNNFLVDNSSLKVALGEVQKATLSNANTFLSASTKCTDNYVDCLAIASGAITLTTASYDADFRQVAKKSLVKAFCASQINEAVRLGLIDAQAGQNSIIAGEGLVFNTPGVPASGLVGVLPCSWAYDEARL